MIKWALIVGASGDIGQQTAYDLAADGWSLYLHFFSKESRIEELCADLQEKYPHQEFISIQADMTDSAAVDQIVNNVFSLNAIVFAQGTTYYGLFADLKQSQLETMIKMQVEVPLLLVQRFQDKLAAAKNGRIVFIGSVYGGSGSAMEVGYSTVKGALSAFAKAYSKEVASLGITVNVIAPGAVDTEMNQLFSPEAKADVASEIPRGRFAQTKEISYWVKTMLQPEAGYLTGETVYVTGGWLK